MNRYPARLWIALVVLATGACSTQEEGETEKTVAFTTRAAEVVAKGESDFSLGLAKGGIDLSIESEEFPDDISVPSIKDFVEKVRAFVPTRSIPGYPELVYGWNYMKDGDRTLYDVADAYQELRTFVSEDDGYCSTIPDGCGVGVDYYIFTPLSVVGDVVSYLGRVQYMATGAPHPVGWTSIHVINRKTLKPVHLKELVDEAEIIRAYNKVIPALLDEVDSDMLEQWNRETAKRESLRTLKEFEDHVEHEYERNCDFPWSSLDYSGFTVSGYDAVTNQAQLTIGMSAITNACREFMLPVSITVTPNDWFREQLLTVVRDNKGQFMQYKDSDEETDSAETAEVPTPAQPQ